jgi:hypothetical protein
MYRLHQSYISHRQAYQQQLLAYYKARAAKFNSTTSMGLTTRYMSGYDMVHVPIIVYIKGFYRDTTIWSANS